MASPLKQLRVWYNMVHWMPSNIDPTENDRGVSIDKYVSFLFSNYNLILDPNTPQIVFYDGPLFNQKQSYLKYPNSYRVYITGESYDVFPQFNDISISYCDDSSKNIHAPFWCMFLNWKDATAFDYIYRNLRIRTYSHTEASKRKFCSYIASNDVGFRNNFVRNLMRYKKVDCSGRCLNNTPQTKGRMGIDKHNTIKNYKFVVCFENKKKKGYVTEKIYHALNADTIPIYWGSESVFDYFNGNRFLFYDDFSSEADLIRKIEEIDKDDLLFSKILNEPIFLNGVPEFIKPENIRAKMTIK